MNARTWWTSATLLAVFGAGLAVAQDKKDAKPAAGKQESKPNGGGEMMDPKAMEAMMALAQPGENHKLLSQLAGEWTYTSKFWMGPGDPQVSGGSSVVKPILDGRFYVGEHKGNFEMPGPDGKMQNWNFHGLATNGYDNFSKKFLTTWIDNMGTTIMMFEGTYDPAKKAFTYTAEMDDCMTMSGKKIKVREVIRIVDNDHHVMEWYETRDGQEMKTMEISYQRKK